MFATLIVHLFPTTFSVLCAINVAVYPTGRGLFYYIIAALLGGLVHAAEMMATDNMQFSSLAAAVDELSITAFEVESFREILPAAGANYISRRLKKERRPKECLAFSSLSGPVKHPLAFNFRRFYPICIHSLGKSAGKSRRSMILYHEIGHLFFLQPRGGFISLMLGGIIPLLWTIFTGTALNFAMVFSFAIVSILEILSISIFSPLEREIFADGFALASKFTEIWDGLSPSDIKEVEKRGLIFAEPPKAVQVYERTVKARGRYRAWMFKRAYGRMNIFGSLNKRFMKYARQSAGMDLYWSEVFYRRALQGIFDTPTLIVSPAKVALMAFIVAQGNVIALTHHLMYVISFCAIMSIILLWNSTRSLVEVNMMITQAINKEHTTVLVVEEIMKRNIKKHKENEASTDNNGDWFGDTNP